VKAWLKLEGLQKEMKKNNEQGVVKK